MTEAFEGLCPWYMAIGMSYNEFWYASPSLVVAYRDAHNLKRKMRNEELYLQGLYNYNAFSAGLENFSYGLNGKKGSRPKGYLQKPFDIGEKTQAEKKAAAKAEREKAINSLNAWKKAWESRYGNS